MGTMSKIFIFDMDGTIVNTKSKILPETVLALKEARAKGHLTIIATGRPFADIVKDLEETLFDYLIANNGAYYYEVASKKFTYFDEVPNHLINAAIKIGTKYKCMFAVHGSQKAMRASLMGDIELSEGPYEEWMKFDLETVKNIQETMTGQRIMQVSLRGTKADIDIIKPQFKKFENEVDIHIANDVYLDINPKGVSKLVGIKKVLNEINRELKDVYAFGDSGNDLDMIIGSGTGIAMGNANEEALNAADVIIGNNDSTAIADKIRELI